MNLPERIGRARRLLASVEKNHANAAFSSSFGAEDMVVLDLIAHDGLAIETFTIDTGRLPSQTHDLIKQVRRRYALEVTTYSPWPESVDAYVGEYGRDGFYLHREAREACCALRKVEPLARALAGKRGWVTGLRRAQSGGRAGIEEAAQDPERRLWKFNPLADWSEADVWTYLRDHGVPYNALHDRGYPSIGCEPCTRAVKPGEPARAGRWWWEGTDSTQECGLHPRVIPIREIA